MHVSKFVCVFRFRPSNIGIQMVFGCLYVFAHNLRGEFKSYHHKQQKLIAITVHANVFAAVASVIEIKRSNGKKSKSMLTRYQQQCVHAFQKRKKEEKTKGENYTATECNA